MKIFTKNVRSVTLGVFVVCAINLHADYQSEFNNANELFKQNNHDAAIEAYKKVLNSNPQCHQAHFNLGLVYSQKSAYDLALSCFNQAVSLDPSYDKAHFHTGHLYAQMSNTDKALEHFNKAIELNKNNHDAYLNKARIFSAQSKFDTAIENFKIAVQLHPKDPNILLELANTLNMANKIEDALAIYYDILKILPDNASILYNIAYTLKKLGRVQEALPIYFKVLQLDPQHSEAHFSLGLAYLTTGDFDRGWEEYEWRWKRNNQDGRNMKKPLWDGSDLHGKTILLHAEQGLGDTFQFIRYAQIAKEKGGTVIAAVQPALIQFLSLCPYIDRVVSLFEALPTYDVQAPMLTLPLILKTRIDTIPVNIPYLYADPTLVTYWKEKLAHDKNFKVGICWQGNSNYSTHFLRTAVAAKSIQLPKLLPLLTIEGVSVYNLQKITGTDQLEKLPQDTHLISFDNDFDNTHGRFMDTAAVIKNLDLMISIDTSMCHLAAGLGCPVWVMMPEPADWRWMLKRPDTPWYPNMRLFRQPNVDDWESVIDTIAQELKRLVMNHRPSNQLELLTNKIAELELEIVEHETHQVIDDSFRKVAFALYQAIEERNKLKKVGSQSHA